MADKKKGCGCGCIGLAPPVKKKPDKEKKAARKSK